MSDVKPPLWSRSVAAALAVSLGMSLLACRGSDPETMLAEARQFRERGDIRAAVIQLKNLIQKDAGHRSARIMLGELYLDQGDPQSAEKEFRRALDLGADSASLQLLLGRALLMQQSYERILDEIEAPALPALRPATIALRGNAMLGMGRIEEARALFNEALELDPDAPPSLLGLARIAMWQGEPADARSLLARALAGSPHDADCLRFHADLLRADGKGDAALAEHAKILARHPHNAQALVDSANIHTDAGRLDQARALLSAARKVSGNSVGLVYSEAMLHFRDRQLSAALDAVSRVLRAAPDHYPGLLLAGSVHSAMGSHGAAEPLLRKFLQAYPGHVYASKLLAGAHLGGQQPAAALAVLQPLLDKHSADPELLALAGEASLRARQYARAAELFEKASALRPDTAVLHTGLALSKMGDGDHGRAIAELERAARLDRQPERTGVLLVMSYLRAGMADKAFAAVQDMEAQGDNPLVQNLKGGIYMARHDARNARSSFERALRLEPAYLPALANLAQLDKIEHRGADTRRRYLAALAKAPKNGALLEALAALALEAAQPAEAIMYMERAAALDPDATGPALRYAALTLRAGEAHKALAMAQRLQAANPGNTEVLALLGQAYSATRQYAQAADAYTRWSAAAPLAALPRLRLASVAIARNEPQRALESLHKALELDPGLLDARITLINVLVRQKQFHEALEAAAEAQKRHPDSPAGHKLAGDIHSASGDHAAALKSYEHALATAPSGAALIQVYGVLRKLGRDGEADRRIALWFQDHPADVPTRLYYASSKLVRNDPKGAIPHYEAVLKAEPDNLAALNDLAWSYARIGAREALAYAQRAHKIAPDNPAIMDTLGWIYLEQGQLPRALPLLQKASALAPDAGEIRFHYGAVLARAGDRKGARRELEKALASPAPFNGREEAMALLATL